MRLVNFSRDIIREDKLPYSLDNKIEANIYNAGNVVAFIEGIAIPPGSSFQAGITNSITKGNIDITFDSTAVDSTEDRRSKLVCFYGTLVEENAKDPKSECY